MPIPQLSVRSARARELAHRLAMRERCTVAEVVERALEAYAAHRLSRAPASEFYRELNRQYATEVNLEELIQASRSHAPGWFFDFMDTDVISRQPHDNDRTGGSRLGFPILGVFSWLRIPRRPTSPA